MRRVRRRAMQSRRRRGSRSPSCRPQGRCRCMTRSGRSPHRAVGQVVVAALEMSRVGARIGSGILGHQFEGMENRVAYLTEVQVGSLKALLDVLGVVAGLLAYDIAEYGGVSIVVVLIVFPQASHVATRAPESSVGTIKPCWMAAATIARVMWWLSMIAFSFGWPSTGGRRGGSAWRENRSASFSATRVYVSPQGVQGLPSGRHGAARRAYGRTIWKRSS